MSQPFTQRHIGTDADAQAHMLATLGYDSLESLVDAAIPPTIHVGQFRDTGESLTPAGRDRARGHCRAARARRPQHGQALDDRARLLRHDHARGDQAQRAREPELVHGLHALPARDLAGPARGADQLPDHGRRPHRAADRQRVHARRGHGRRRGHAAGPPRVEVAVPAFRRRRGCAPADPCPARQPRPGRRHRTGRARPGRDDERRGPRRALRRLRAVPGRVGPGLEPGGRHRGRPGRGRARRRRGRPARPHPARVAGRAGRRRRGRHQPALRRSDGLRRSARRLHGRARGPRTPAPRPPRRRLRRRRRPPRLPALAAGARAAHPPREGHLEHLHGPGAARRDGVDVRGVPRARGLRAIAAEVHERAAASCAAALAGAGDVASTSFLRHPPGVRARPRRRDRGPRGRGGRQPAPRRRGHDRRLRRRDHHPGRPRHRRRRLRRTGRVRAVEFGAAEHRAARRARPHERVPHPPGLQHAPLGDEHDALPQAPRRQGLRARPRHDPARLLHDEAQRGDRDGGRHLAGVRRASTRSRPAPTWRATSS